MDESPSMSAARRAAVDSIVGSWVTDIDGRLAQKGQSIAPDHDARLWEVVLKGRQQRH